MSNKPEVVLEILLDINKKVDDVQKELTNVRADVYNIDKTLLIQSGQLENHMKRTELNEERLEMFETEVKPALEAYKFVATLSKVLAACIAFGGGALAIWFQFKH